MNRPLALITSCLTAVLLSAALWAAEPPPAPDLAAGRSTYEKSCARCHGVQGAGDGLDAARLYPKPRNLTLGVYKFRSTASGTPPTDEDIFHTLTHGLPGTRMPDWRVLDGATRWQLVYYLKSLAPTFQENQPQPVNLAPDPGRRADVAKGTQLYKDLGCVQCHGATGRGNGPSAATLQDDFGQPILAADLTQGWNFRGGATPRDVALRLLTGIDGTPMPSYVDALADPADAWHLAYYIQSLQPAAQWRDRIEAARVAVLPADHSDAAWQQVPRTDVRLGSMSYDAGAVTPTSVNAVTVQAVHDGATVALRLVWHDRTDSREAPSDRFAVVLRAPDLRGDIVSLQAWPLPEAPALDTLVWSADVAQAVEAVGFDFAATGATARAGEAAYEDGAWVVTLQRPLQPDVEGGIAFRANEPVPIAFAAWDGGNGETGRKRAVSYWLTISVQP